MANSQFVAGHFFLFLSNWPDCERQLYARKSTLLALKKVPTVVVKSVRIRAARKFDLNWAPLMGFWFKIRFLEQSDYYSAEGELKTEICFKKM